MSLGAAPCRTDACGARAARGATELTAEKQRRIYTATRRSRAPSALECAIGANRGTTLPGWKIPPPAVRFLLLLNLRNFPILISFGQTPFRGMKIILCTFKKIIPILEVQIGQSPTPSP